MSASNGRWFTDWFDSPYYHILYHDRDEQEAEFFMDRLAKHLKIKQDDRILDLPCGKGRHAIYLNKKGFDVTGADLSENSIKEASAAANDRLRFIVHDMREPLVTGPFDYILNLFTSFGYFDEEENQKVLCNLKKGLKPGGTLVIDFMNTIRVLDLLVEHEVKSISGIDFRIRRYVQDGIIVKEICFEDNGQSYFFEEQVRALRQEDFERYFRRAGLSIIEMFGDYDLMPYDCQLSERMIFILQ